MVLLAHIREQHRLSHGSYGRPRMTEELNELGLRVGHRRVGRLMRQNAICVIRNHKFEATTDSDHTFKIAPNLLQQDFAASQPNQNRRSAQRNGLATSPMSGRAKAGFIWRSSLICIPFG
jgi:transposase InsO family protein